MLLGLYGLDLHWRPERLYILTVLSNVRINTTEHESATGILISMLCRTPVIRRCMEQNMYCMHSLLGCSPGLHWPLLFQTNKCTFVLYCVDSQSFGRTTGWKVWWAGGLRIEIPGGKNLSTWGFMMTPLSAPLVSRCTLGVAWLHAVLEHPSRGQKSRFDKCQDNLCSPSKVGRQHRVC